MSRRKLSGHIDLIEIADASLVVSGWIVASNKATSPKQVLSLLYGELEIARTNVGAPSEREHRRQFSFRTAIPVGIDEVRSLIVRSSSKNLNIKPDRHTKTLGHLPEFITLDDLCRLQDDFECWQSGQPPTNKHSEARIVFDATLNNGFIDGLAFDLNDPARELSLKMMAGPVEIAQIALTRPAAIELDGNTVQVARGFSVELPTQTRRRAGSDIWFGLAESQVIDDVQITKQRKIPTDTVAFARVVRLNAFDRAGSSSDAKSHIKTAVITSFLNEHDHIYDLLNNLYGARTLCEFIIVHSAPLSDAETILASHFSGLKVTFLPCHGLLSQPKAWNIGARATECNLLVFVNAHVRLGSELLSLFIEEFADEELEIATLPLQPGGRRHAHNHDSAPALHIEPAQCGGQLEIRHTAGWQYAVNGENLPMRLPIVNSEIFACRTSVFRSAGGFDERLLGLAALADFCIRVRMKSLRDPVSFNDLGPMATVPTKSRIHSEDKPLRITSQALVRMLRLDLFERPGFWSGRPPQVLIALPTATGPERRWADGIAATLATVAPANVTLALGTDILDLYGSDLLIVLDPTFDFSNIPGTSSALTVVACALSQLNLSECFESAHAIWVIPEQTEDVFRDNLSTQRIDKRPGPVSLTLTNASENANQAQDVPDPTAESAGLDTDCFEMQARELVSLFRRHATKTIRFAIKIDDQTDSLMGLQRLALSLAAALRELGCAVRIDRPHQWNRSIATSDDCAIVLRSSGLYRRSSAILNLLWVVGHPETVSTHELDRYDHVFAASRRARELFLALTDVPVSTLPLALYPSEHLLTVQQSDHLNSLLILGDLKDCEDSILKCALGAGLNVTVCGNGWGDRVPKHVTIEVPREIENLISLFRKSDFVLILLDRTQQKFGYVSNLTYLAASCGVRLLTGPIVDVDASIERSVRLYSDASSFIHAIESWRAENESHRTERFQLIHAPPNHLSFVERANIIMEVAKELLRSTIMNLPST